MPHPVVAVVRNVNSSGERVIHGQLLQYLVWREHADKLPKSKDDEDDKC